MTVPCTLELTELLNADDLTWSPPSDDLPFRTCLDPDGVRWLVKFRGGFNAVRERAFSVIAQSLGLSCQSSAYLRMPSQPEHWPFVPATHESTDDCQLAIWFLDEHPPPSRCDNCPLLVLNDQFRKRPYDIELLRMSPIADILDWPRGEMLGMLCEMHELPGRLFTADHSFVQIDNELMFSRHAGADLRDSPWVSGGSGRLNREGLNEAIRLCERVSSLPEAVFREALRMPDGYVPTMLWSVRKEIDCIRPRARGLSEVGDSSVNAFRQLLRPRNAARRAVIRWDGIVAASVVTETLLSRLPGQAWQGGKLAVDARPRNGPPRVGGFGAADPAGLPPAGCCDLPFGELSGGMCLPCFRAEAPWNAEWLGREMGGFLRARGAHFVFTAKGNQPTLLDDLRVFFENRGEPDFREPPALEHGRIESRAIWTTARLNGYLTFPHLGQAFLVERTAITKKSGKTSVEYALGITSHTPDTAAARRLLELNRGHWKVESVHNILDNAFDEDRLRIRTGHGPENTTRLRRFAIGVVRAHGNRCVAAAMRRLDRNPRRVFDYLRMSENTCRPRKHAPPGGRTN